MNQSVPPPSLSAPPLATADSLSDRGVVVSGHGGTTAPRSLFASGKKRNVWIAKALFDNEYEVWPIDIESEDKPFGLTVADQSCAICGGFFPRVGQLRGFYAADGTFNLVHIGCAVECGNWVEA